MSCTSTTTDPTPLSANSRASAAPLIPAPRMSTDEGILNRRKGRKRRERRQGELLHQECDSQLGCLFSRLRILSILLILSKNLFDKINRIYGIGNGSLQLRRFL